MLRLGAIAMTVLPAVLGLLLRDLAWGPWLGAGLAMLGGVALTVARPRARSLVLLGTMLTVLAGLAAPQFPLADPEPQHIDLRQADAPPDLDGLVEVDGFFRPEWTLAEYAVPDGALPQQDRNAEAVLVPFLGVEDGPTPLRQSVLVARVSPGAERASGLQTLRGHARPLDDELLSTIVQASGVPAPPELQGILLDTVDVDADSPPWLRGGLVLLAMLGAFVCLWIATRPLPPAPEEDPA